MRSDEAISFEPEKAGQQMDEQLPHIDVRAVDVNDAPALYELDYNFETDRIYALRVKKPQNVDETCALPAFAFELIETQVDPPLYRSFFEAGEVLQAEVEARVRQALGGYVALVDGVIAGGVLLLLEPERAVARVQELIVGRQYRRYGVGSLLLSCASDWARERGCWAIELETQNTNYPAIQFYLRNGLEIWGINRNFYPPGAYAHEVAILLGKRLRNNE